jgi:ABC-2 type transport system ATP-binding protein
MSDLYNQHLDAQKTKSNSDRKHTIKVTGLRKSYGEPPKQTDALIGVDLTVYQGEIFGILGPNGAGKTTFIEILEGLRRSTAGTAHVLDVDVNDTDALKNIRPRLGISTQHSVLPPLLTITEVLTLVKSLYPKPQDPLELIQTLGLEEKKNTQFSKLSGGQQQRVALALALIGNPELIFLDEPTSQLDPQARRVVWDILLDQRNNKSASILLTTHQMEEAERLCDRVLILDHGKILAIGRPRELIDKHCPQRSIEFIVNNLDGIDEFSDDDVITREIKMGQIRVKIKSDDIDQALLKLTTLQTQKKLNFSELRIETQTLEDVFLELTGRSIRQ